MLNEVAKQWVAALRSGEYKQGTGRLKDGERYCCLGVLCDLAVKADKIEPVDEFEKYDGEGAVLPLKVQKWVRLRHNNGRQDGPHTALSILNDYGRTFEQIADIIESEPKWLFKD